MEWVSYVTYWLLAGLLGGEIYMIGARRRNRTPRGLEYLFCVFLTPLFIALILARIACRAILGR